MKTNKLPQSAWSDSQAAGSQAQQLSQSKARYPHDSGQHANSASNDARYDSYDDERSDHLARDTSLQDSYFGYKSIDKSLTQAKEFAMIENGSTGSIGSNDPKNSDSENFDTANGYKKASGSQKISGYKETSGYKKVQEKQAQKISELDAFMSEDHADFSTEKPQKTDDLSLTATSYKKIPEHIFMNGLIKHTGIALAIIIPLAAFSAYAAPLPATMSANKASATATTDKATTETLSVKPSSIMHSSANVPTTVDSVDLKQYAGTWYEIGRLPMYFQRNCASDVTANYTEKTDGSGIIVTNKCQAEDGSGIVAEGLAKPADDTGSKLKVTFLPSWIRWLPVGRADYWVLARDPDYKTALVGTPDKGSLWLLARSPNISQETYAKYRQIAQQQGYDLKEFKLTAHSNQTVTLVP